MIKNTRPSSQRNDQKQKINSKEGELYSTSQRLASITNGEFTLAPACGSPSRLTQRVSIPLSVIPAWGS